MLFFARKVYIHIYEENTDLRCTQMTHTICHKAVTHPTERFTGEFCCIPHRLLKQKYLIADDAFTQTNSMVRRVFLRLLLSQQDTFLVCNHVNTVP